MGDPYLGKPEGNQENPRSLNKFKENSTYYERGTIQENQNEKLNKTRKNTRKLQEHAGVDTEKIDKGWILRASRDIWKYFQKSFPCTIPKKY